MAGPGRAESLAQRAARRADELRERLRDRAPEIRRNIRAASADARATVERALTAAVLATLPGCTRGASLGDKVQEMATELHEGVYSADPWRNAASVGVAFLGLMLLVCLLQAVSWSTGWALRRIASSVIITGVPTGETGSGSSQQTSGADVAVTGSEAAGSESSGACGNAPPEGLRARRPRARVETPPPPRAEPAARADGLQGLDPEPSVDDRNMSTPHEIEVVRRDLASMTRGAVTRRLLMLLEEGGVKGYTGRHQFGRYREWYAVGTLFGTGDAERAYRRYMMSQASRCARGHGHPQLRWMVRTLEVYRRLQDVL